MYFPPVLMRVFVESELPCWWRRGGEEAVSEWCGRRGRRSLWGGWKEESRALRCARCMRAPRVSWWELVSTCRGGADEPAPAAGALGRENVAGEIV